MAQLAPEIRGCGRTVLIRPSETGKCEMQGFRMIVFIGYICILLTVGVYAETGSPQNNRSYFQQFPSSWTKITPNSDTAVVATSEKRNVRVIIKTRREQHPAPVKQNAVIEGGLCKYATCINITVNDKQVLVPVSVFSDLNDLNRAKVFIDGEISVLMLDGGDASTGYYVKIEFDGERVMRRIVGPSEARNVVSQETIYYKVVLFKDE